LPDVELHTPVVKRGETAIIEGETVIGELMKKLGVSYSYRFNHKYDRSGHLFLDRYKSETVDDDSYFLAMVRYIHRNPQKAGLQPFIRTSYSDYVEL